MRLSEIINEDWNKVNKQDKTDGLSKKAVKAYRRENPGSKLQTAVTTKPSKLKPGSKAAKRRKSFCARMSGNKGPMKKPNGKPTPKALALRRWNCESIEEMRNMILEGEKMIAEIKKGQKDSNGFTKCWPGKHAEGTKKGKNGKPVRNCVPNESVNEMDKSQKGSPGWNISDHNSDGKEKYVKPAKSKSVAKDALKSLNKEMGKTHKEGVAEGSLEEYGDTAKGQKMLTKVQKRAVDRVTSKKADTDPKYAKKNSDSANRAWDRMTDKDLEEAWSQKYKSSINCSSPKGFSQKAHCAGKKK